MRSLWNQSEAGQTLLDNLVYLSRVMGQDESLVLWGGGNTSIKTEGQDLLGRPTLLMYIKGTGSDMKAAQSKDFPALRLEEIRACIDRDDMTDDEMVAYLAKCMTDPASPRPSIETLLHGYLDATAVAHSHADAILSLTNTAGREETVTEALGNNVAIVGYRRPGFLLAKEVGLAVRDNPRAEGVVLMNHGLITWGDTAQEAYERHIGLVSRAEAFIAGRSGAPRPPGRAGHGPLREAERRAVAATVAPALRRVVSQRRRKVLRFDDAPEVLDFVGGGRIRELAEVGAATPDHILNTKRCPLVVEPDDPSRAESVIAAIDEAIATYTERYLAYYERYRTDEPLLDPAPRVILVAGLGMWCAGTDARAALIPADIYRHTIEVINGAEAIDRYATLDEPDAFSAEYWPLELYKLTLAPRERELAGRVALITGAAGAIGSAIARRLAAEGAHVVVTDLDLPRPAALAQEITAHNGFMRAEATILDVTDEASVAAAFDFASLTYGGVDIVVSNAGFGTVAPLEDLSLAEWQRSFAVNATGHFLVTHQSMRLLRRQGLGGAMVFLATKNVTAPGKDFGAYSAAKAAEAQLARVAAIEAAPFGVRVNMVNPDAVFAGSGLWSEAVRHDRARSYGIADDELEEFYRGRNLLKASVTPEDVAEAVFWLASDRSAKTTGAMIPVDGGLREAFPR